MTRKLPTILVFILVAAELPHLVLAQSARVIGNVTFRDPHPTFAPTAYLELTLEDVSRADAAATVAARMRIDHPSAAPIHFELAYDAGHLDRNHRYALRARVKDGDHLLFTSTDTVLVVTQGHDSSADLALTKVEAPPVAAAAKPAADKVSKATLASMPVPAPTPPALAGLPATFTGMVSCADCGAGAKVQLTLFADDAFVAKTTRTSRGALAVDDVGSWVLSSDRRVLVLKGSGDAPEYFAVKDSQTLRKLDADGREPKGTASDLRRGAMLPIDARATMTGVLRMLGTDGSFTECTTGETWPLSFEGGDPVLSDAYAKAAHKPGDPVIVTAMGHLAARAKSDKSAAVAPVLTIERFVSTSKSGKCETRFAAAPLEQTTWVLSRLNNVPVVMPAAVHSAPTLSFREDPRTFSGSGACNRVTGAYELLGDAISFTPANATLKTCTAGGTDAIFRSALTDARTWRILGRTLELQDAKNQTLARFQASK